MIPETPAPILNQNSLAPFPDFHNYDGEYNKIIAGHGHFVPEMYFYLRTKQPPNIISFADVDGSKAIKAICMKYNLGTSHALTHKSVDHTKLKHKTEYSIVQINSEILLYYNNSFDIFQVMHTDKVSASELNEIESVIKQHLKKETYHQLNLLVYDQELNSFILSEFTLKENSIDIALHYNDDFVPIHKIISQRLSEESSKGIVLLHGNPGTGKTSYIRHLIRNINKKLIYIPSNLASRLGDPDFLPFLVKQSGSVLIIEDAEDILQERTGGDNGTMANLLNLGDGLLSDCLNIQIICTFNAPLTRIDKALLRKGRVIASYEFKPLSIEKSNYLLNSLGVNTQTDKELSLAEIFYQMDTNFLNGEAKSIGFGK